MIRRKTVFDNRRVFEQYCQDDVTVLRQACQIFRRDFIEIGNVDGFLEPCTIASACNKLLSKRFLKSETIGLICAGGYSCNQNYSKNAFMWLLHMEEMNGWKIMHARNGRECRLPELPRFGVDGYCAETRIVYEFLGFFPRLQMPPVPWSQNHERRHPGRTMSRIEQITRAGYEVKCNGNANLVPLK